MFYGGQSLLAISVLPFAFSGTVDLMKAKQRAEWYFV